MSTSSLVQHLVSPPKVCPPLAIPIIGWAVEQNTTNKRTHCRHTDIRLTHISWQKAHSSRFFFQNPFRLLQHLLSQIFFYIPTSQIMSVSQQGCLLVPSYVYMYTWRAWQNVSLSISERLLTWQDSSDNKAFFRAYDDVPLQLPIGRVPDGTFKLTKQDTFCAHACSYHISCARADLAQSPHFFLLPYQ